MGEAAFGIDFSALREIKSLQTIHHPNVICLHDVFMHKKNVNIVLDFMEFDVETLIKDRSVLFLPAHIKSWMLMLLRGVHECHVRGILHRDLKPNNLLIAADGTLKLADFGLSRRVGMPQEPMTSQVVTRWYRAPELLFGSRSYTAAVDMWAAGCIFAELMLRVPFLAGDSDMSQLNAIFRSLGTPSDADWPGMSALPDFVRFPVHPKTPLSTFFSAADATTLDLLSRMLAFDPAKRITALDALRHPYFSQQPRPTAPSLLPKKATSAAPS